MKSNRAQVETHLANVKVRLAAYGATLAAKKSLVGRKCRLDTKYREIESEVRTYTKRLKAMDKIDARNVDLETRRADRLANPKVKKVRVKAAAAPAPKAKSVKAPKKA